MSNTVERSQERMATYRMLDRFKTAEREAIYQIDLLVTHARTLGMTWSEIAEALGVSTQGAWQRYSNHERDSEVPPQDMLPID